MSKDTEDLLAMPEFLKRDPPTEAERIMIAGSLQSLNLGYNHGPSEWRRGEVVERPTNEQVAKMEQLGWTRDQCMSILRCDADKLIELRSPPSARFAFTKVVS